MSRVICIYGPNFTGKSSFAGSGDGRKFYAEMDPGSFSRANFRNPDLFDLHKYHAPLTSLLDMGKISVGAGGGTAPAPVHRLRDWKELFWKFVTDYLAALDQDYSDFVWDTGTKLWLLVHNAFQQEVQEATGNAQARLDALKYTEPNSRMDQLIEASRIKEKNLIIVAHQGEVYQKNEPTGIPKADGYKEVENIADVTLRFSLQGKKPVATVTKAGAGGLELIDMQIHEPTLPGVMKLLDAAEAIRRKGLGMPATPDEVIALGSRL